MNETTDETKPKKNRKRQNQDFSEAMTASKEQEAKAAAERAAAIAPRTVSIDLDVRLTPEELQACVDDLVANTAEEESLLNQKKQVTDTFKGKIQLNKDSRRELMTQLQKKVVVRPVECVETFDFERNTVTTTRTDTNAVVRTRAMTGSERQLCLPVAPVEKNSSEATEHPPKVDDVPEAPGSGVRVPGASSVELVEDGTDIDNPEAILDLDDGSAE